MSEITLRAMRPDDWDEVAQLICFGTNQWYEAHAMGPVFVNGPDSARLFCEVYESLDPGCCILAVAAAGQIVGSCFYHPRPTHVSLGIMNAHPDHFGTGIASRLLQFVIDFAKTERKPVRLVSSALNLDSYSLYTRAGFVPQAAYQDMLLHVPESGLDVPTEGCDRVREATADDIPAMAALETELNHISREKDYRHFVENRAGIWHASVLENTAGSLDGFLVSVHHPGSNMLGPGHRAYGPAISRTDPYRIGFPSRPLARLLDPRRAKGLSSDDVPLGCSHLRAPFRTGSWSLPATHGRGDAHVHPRDGIGNVRDGDRLKLPRRAEVRASCRDSATQEQFRRISIGIRAVFAELFSRFDDPQPARKGIAMALKKSQSEQLKLARKRRARRPTPTVQLPPTKLTVNHRERERVTNSHAWLLMRIERTLVASWQDHADVDDHAVASALRLAITNGSGSNGNIPDHVREIASRLTALDALAETNQVLNVALRTIYSSVKTRSGCRPHEYNYLNYAREFVTQFRVGEPSNEVRTGGGIGCFTSFVRGRSATPWPPSSPAIRRP